MDNIVIENTRPTLITLPDVPAKKDKNNKLIREGYVGARLMPGENDVPASYWEVVKKNSGVLIWTGARHLVNKGKGKASKILESLDGLAPEMAKRQIGKCVLTEVLTGWAQNTENRALQKLIHERKLEIIATSADTPMDQVFGAAGEVEA